MNAARRSRELQDGWEIASAAAGELEHPGDISGLGWQPAEVPGTVAMAFRAAGGALEGDWAELEARDWWFRTEFDAASAEAGEQTVLAFDGLATVADVYLNGEHVLRSESMFASHRIDVTGMLSDRNQLAVCCRALRPLLAQQRRPRARWRTALVGDGNLRFYRTMLLGRAPGFAPGPPVIGPWRAVRLESDRAVAVRDLRLRPRLEETDGVLAVELTASMLAGAAPPERIIVSLSDGGTIHGGELRIAGGSTQPLVAGGELRVPDAEPWWPHTHGRPALYQLEVRAEWEGEERLLHSSQIGFRKLEWDSEWERNGLRLRINSQPIFVRGAVWTPLDLLNPDQRGESLRPVLERVVDCGMNMLRIPGIAAYESSAFHDLCDQLGILVWQDFMFANLDYPDQSEEFIATIEREARQVLGDLGPRPSLAVLCGGSECAQQVTMLGLDPELARGPLYTELLPRLIEETGTAVPYVPNSPWGGELPFRTDSGIANYYGVGAYLRPLSDARLADVKFASECLAFSNVPDDEAMDAIGPPASLVPHHPAWKAGVPRDTGAGWDFEDVRDHYLRLLFEADPVALRWADPARYLELSRVVTGEVMAEVFGEWRRAASNCSGGLVLWLADLRPGAGWGVLDHTGAPKVAYHHLRRALAPVAVWTTDEGLGGVRAHIANDTQAPLDATLRVALYRDFETLVRAGSVEIKLAAHGCADADLEAILGGFVDVNWSYRFGAPSQDLIVVSITGQKEPGTELLSQSFRFPVGRPARRETVAELGLRATARRTAQDTLAVVITSRRLAYGVRISAPGFTADDDAFSVEPGGQRSVVLRPAAAMRQIATSGSETSGPAVSISAVNLAGRVKASVE